LIEAAENTTMVLRLHLVSVLLVLTFLFFALFS
jgi:hypothetical protein